MDFTADELIPILEHHLGGTISIDEIVRFPRGSSRETRFLVYRRDGGAAEELVLRSDIPAGSLDPTPLDQEYFLYERLGHTSVPAARVLFWEDDPARTDRPFYAREKIEGDWNIAHFSDPDPAYDALRIAIAKEHIAKLAMVHAVDWRALGFGDRLPVPRDAADAAGATLRFLRSRFLELAKEPIPLLLEAIEWLMDRAPPAAKLCLCKGTNGYGEEVFRDGKVVALSDWEEASIGDPAADFAFMQGFLGEIVRDGETLWSLRHALDHYAELTGIRIAPEVVGYYQVIRALRLAILSHHSAIALGRPGEVSIRHGWTATEILHMGKHVLASAMTMVPPVSAQRFAELNDSIDIQ